MIKVGESSPRLAGSIPQHSKNGAFFKSGGKGKLRFFNLQATREAEFYNARAVSLTAHEYQFFIPTAHPASHHDTAFVVRRGHHGRRASAGFAVVGGAGCLGSPGLFTSGYGAAGIQPDAPDVCLFGV